MIVAVSPAPVVRRLPRTLTYLGFRVTDDIEILPNRPTVPQYKKSISFRNNLLGTMKHRPFHFETLCLFATDFARPPSEYTVFLLDHLLFQSDTSALLIIPSPKSNPERST